MLFWLECLGWSCPTFGVFKMAARMFPGDPFAGVQENFIFSGDFHSKPVHFVPAFSPEKTGTLNLFHFNMIHPGMSKRFTAE